MPSFFAVSEAFAVRLEAVLPNSPDITYAAYQAEKSLLVPHETEMSFIEKFELFASQHQDSQCDLLLFSGYHGDSTMLNNLSMDAIDKMVAIGKKYGVTFDKIHADCCFATYGLQKLSHLLSPGGIAVGDRITSTAHRMFDEIEHRAQMPVENAVTVLDLINDSSEQVLEEFNAPLFIRRLSADDAFLVLGTKESEIKTYLELTYRNAGLGDIAEDFINAVSTLDVGEMMVCFPDAKIVESRATLLSAYQTNLAQLVDSVSVGKYDDKITIYSERLRDMEQKFRAFITQTADKTALIQDLLDDFFTQNGYDKQAPDVQCFTAVVCNSLPDASEIMSISPEERDEYRAQYCPDGQIDMSAVPTRWRTQGNTMSALMDELIVFYNKQKMSNEGWVYQRQEKSVQANTMAEKQEPLKERLQQMKEEGINATQKAVKDDQKTPSPTLIISKGG